MEEVFPYTPRKATFDTLQATFVARQAMLDEVITSIREQAKAETLQHWMILGSRGMGKSHLVTMIYHMVKTDPLLNSQWTPVLMNEEESGVFSLATLFMRILAKLADELDKSDREWARKAFSFLDNLRSSGSAPDRIMESIRDCLKEYVSQSGKRLLVLLENADDLFTKCLPKANEVKQLRKILQHENDMLVIATSPTFFEGIRNKKGVLYDFFRLRRLELLTYEEAIRLLKKWADLAGDNIGKEFKASDYRLKMLYHLTGGNPRILLFLYMAIAGQKKIESSVVTFQILLEKDLSNYYLSRLRDIPNQEQPIVIALAETDHNLTQKEIAARTFLPLRSIGAFMGRLENAGLVRPVTEKKGKNTYYTLTDHMFRLWHQWRTNVREKQVIEALVEFLSIWYRRSELEQLLSCDGFTSDYAREALNFRKSERFKGHMELLYSDSREAFKMHLTDRNLRAAMDTAELLQEYSDQASDDIETPLIDSIGNMETIETLEDCFERLKEHNTVQTACVFIELARKFIGKKSFEKAEETLKKAVELEQGNVIAWQYLGVARIELKDFKGAEEAMKKAVELAPDDAIGWLNLGTTFGIQGNVAEEEAAITKAAELNPENAQAWQNLGVARGEQGNHAGAEAALTRAVELAPDDAGTWQNLGAARRGQGNYAGAEEALTKAVELAPDDAEAWQGLGVARGVQGNHGGAEEALIKAVKLSPENATAWRLIGTVCGEQGNYAGAEEALNKAVELSPENATAWRLIGTARGEQGNYAGAEEALVKAVELSPSDAEAWQNLGVARGEQRNYAGAEEALTRALELSPSDANAWQNLGTARGGQGNFAGAEEAFTRAVELAPENATAWRLIGVARGEQGNYAGAEEALVKAVELSPSDADAWQNLGVARGEQGNDAGAEEALTRAVELAPSDADAWQNLGVARRGQGNYAGAEEALNKVVELAPENATAWRFLGAARGVQGNHTGAEEALTRAVELAPDDADAWQNLGVARGEQGNHEGEEEALKKTIELAPTNELAWDMLLHCALMNYRIRDCIVYAEKGLLHTDNKLPFFRMLGEIETRIEEVPELLERFEQYLRQNDIPDTQKASLYFLRAAVLLHKKEMTSFSADLQNGAALMENLTEEERGKISGELIDYLVGATYGDDWDEIITYLETFHEIAPERAAVFSPLNYVIDYLKAAEEKGGRKMDKPSVMKRIEIALDRVPTELRKPVEDMVNTIKENQEWWAKRSM